MVTVRYRQEIEKSKLLDIFVDLYNCVIHCFDVSLLAYPSQDNNTKEIIIFFLSPHMSKFIKPLRQYTA